MRAHLSLILVHIGVGKRCRAADVESPAILPSMSTRHAPAGRWMRAQGIFNRRAHMVSPILVHVGVGQRCRAADHGESPAILPTMSTVAHIMMGAHGRFNRRALFAAPLWNHVSTTHVAQYRSSGALDESSSKVQHASTPSQPGSRTRWCRSALPCPRCGALRHSANHAHT
jgi:hypothetical protein